MQKAQGEDTRLQISQIPAAWGNSFESRQAYEYGMNTQQSGSATFRHSESIIEELEPL